MHVFYDFTRLHERLLKRNLTGIDRVDLRYALWFFEFADSFRGVIQTSRGFSSLKDDELAKLLENLRISGVKKGPRNSGRILQIDAGSGEKRASLHEKFRRVAFLELVRERGLLVSLWSRLPLVPKTGSVSFPTGVWTDWSYVNIGHCLGFEVALASLPENMKRIYFLHDLIPLLYPETQRMTSQLHFRRLAEFMDHPHSQIITSSQVTVDAMKDVRGVFDNLSFQPQVIPLAVEDHFKDSNFARSSSEDPPFFVCVGTIEPRKNLRLLLDIWERLINEVRSPPKLVWIGKRSWFEGNELDRIQRLKQSCVFEERSDLEDSEMLKLMRRACALLFPSKAEGWGLPLAEALSLHVPVIASDLPIFREVGQGLADLLPLDDSERWVEAILEYANPISERRRDQLVRIQAYRPVSWEMHFSKLQKYLEL